jgi:hypothetical protein
VCILISGAVFGQNTTLQFNTAPSTASTPKPSKLEKYIHYLGQSAGYDQYKIDFAFAGWDEEQILEVVRTQGRDKNVALLQEDLNTKSILANFIAGKVSKSDIIYRFYTKNNIK